MAKIQVVFYSMYGHIYRMAEAVSEGAREVAGTEVTLLRVPELVPAEALERAGALDAQLAFAHIPVAEIEQLARRMPSFSARPPVSATWRRRCAIFSIRPTGLWMRGGLIGKVGSVFTSAATQHGGQETTITSFHTTLLHHGMVIVGVPYSEARQMTVDKISGGSPYGASTITGGRGERMPSENELAIARFQGRHVAEITRRLVSTSISA